MAEVTALMVMPPALSSALFELQLFNFWVCHVHSIHSMTYSVKVRAGNFVRCTVLKEC